MLPKEQRLCFYPASGHSLRHTGASMAGPSQYLTNQHQKNQWKSLSPTSGLRNTQTAPATAEFAAG